MLLGLLSQYIHFLVEEFNKLGSEAHEVIEIEDVHGKLYCFPMLHVDRVGHHQHGVVSILQIASVIFSCFIHNCVFDPELLLEGINLILEDDYTFVEFVSLLFV